MAANALRWASTVEQEHDGASDSGVLWAPVSSRLLKTGQRRMEASTFLTDGYGLRQGLEAVSSTVKFSGIAEIWQPSRLKGYVVDAGKGLPFLSAGQVFESKPRIRKWLAEALVPLPDSRRVDDEWLLLSCSGEVGRVTAVYAEHLEKIITHDLLRVVPGDAEDYGWLYAYMKTPTFFAIARSAQYGHMIKHLEPEHVREMPVAMPDEETRARIGGMAQEAISKRKQARRLQARADEAFGLLISPNGAVPSKAIFSIVKSSDLWSGRRRFEGQYHRDEVRQVDQLVRAAANRLDPLNDLVKSISLGARFKRHFGENGTAYRSASELFDVNPPVTKRIFAALLPKPERYMLRAGEIIMARSGQSYGLLGRSVVLTENHEGIFGSDDLIRIVPDEDKVRTAYLNTVLNHVEYGRPRIIRYASGTSIPHLDPVDVREVLIPRFDDAVEAEIAVLSGKAIDLSADADRLESKAVAAAEAAIAALTGRHGVAAH